jgi:hypothetical protein
MSLKVSRCLPAIGLLLLVQLQLKAQQSMCAPVSNNPLVMENLCNDAPRAQALPSTQKNGVSKPARESLTLTAAQINSMRLSDIGAQERPDSKARLAKNLRYNGGRCDLTQTEEGCFMEQYESQALPFIPLGEGEIAFKGQVSKVGSYLSEDRTHIYTEITWRVQEIFKQPKDLMLSSDEMIITDQIGGSVKIASGRIARDDTRYGFMGRPYVGGHYVVFVKMNHKGEDLTVIRAYELSDGKVFKLTEDGTAGSKVLSKKPNQPDFLSKEDTFLKAVRSRARKAQEKELQ